MQIDKGNYFLHYSLLKEASESWVKRKQQTNAGMFIMRLFFSKNNTPLTISSCNRTIKKIDKGGEKLAFSPALFDMIIENSLIGYDDLEDDQYSLKVASLKATIPHPIYFIVSDNNKETITKLANEKGYHSIKIMSPLDFGFKAEL